MKNITKNLFKFAGIVIVIFIVFNILYIVTKMPRLQYFANRKADTLNTLSFVEGEETQATGYVNGDFLTAKDSVDESTFASAVFMTGASLGPQFKYATTNLEDAGYKIDGKDGEPYFSYISNRDSDVSFLSFRYINEDENTGIRVQYTLNLKNECNREMTCKHNRNTDFKDSTYDYAKLFNTKVNRVEVRYSSLNQNYFIHLSD